MYERIMQLCEERGISRRALEIGAGIGNGTISHWKDHEPYASKLYAVAQFFDVTMEYLLVGKDPM